MTNRIPKSRERGRIMSALGCGPAVPENVERKKRAVKASAKAAKRAQKARGVAALGDAPCPRRVLLTAALAGDKDARWTAENIYGRGWRTMAEREVGR